jgi:hypothetical protein
VLVAAIGLAALRSSSQTWAGLLLLTTLGAFGIALVGAVCRSGSERGGWFGFAVFGWIYMSAAFWPSNLWPELPTQSLLEAIGPRLGAIGAQLTPFSRSGVTGGGTAGAVPDEWFFQIGHCMLALLAAGLGALLGSRLFVATAGKSEKITLDSQAPSDTRPGKRWVAPLVVAMSTLALIAAIASAGAILPPGIWAGSTFLLTWFLIGLVALGALIGRARPREAWLGATVFGAGIMILAFGRSSDERWPGPPTADLLNEIRPWLPSIANGRRSDPKSITAAHARIHEALNQPVPMHFLKETPLEDVLNSIKTATTGADDKSIPIYVDPIGLLESDKTMTSTVTNIDLDSVPLRTSLRLCLAQLDLAYYVKDGLLLITSRESEDLPLSTATDDAFQVVGHCVLALIAAALGGLAAPCVCGMGRKAAARDPGNSA